jgi:hypothetical protein
MFQCFLKNFFQPSEPFADPVSSIIDFHFPEFYYGNVAWY